MLIHEIWGLSEHIRDIADRLALAGYLTVAPDLLGLTGLDAALPAELGERRAGPGYASLLQAFRARRRELRFGMDD